MVDRMMFFLLLLQDPTYDLYLDLQKGQSLVYEHSFTVNRASYPLKVKYTIVGLDKSRQHSGEYKAETDGKTFVFRSGSHG